MLRQLKSRAAYAAAAAAVTGSLLLPFAAGAQQGQAGVALSPPTHEFTVAPGETIRKQIEVKNLGSESREFSTTVNNFNASGEEGGMAFSPFGDLASWTTVAPASFSIPGDGTRVLDVTMIVPTNASPGGHYATVFAVAKPSAVAGGTGIGVGQYIGSNFLVNVTGFVREGGSIVEFSTVKPSYEQAEFLPFTLRIRNDGNTHIRPTGVIEIFKGSAKVASASLNTDQGSVLPGSIRKFSAVSEKTLPAGKYTARATLAFAGQTMQSGTISFTVVGKNPLLTISVVLGAAFILVLAYALRPKQARAVVK